MRRTSRLTRTLQKWGSRDFSRRWNWSEGVAGFNWRSKAVVLTAFCSSPERRASESVKVSAMRNSIRRPGRRSLVHPKNFHDLVAEVVDDFDGDAVVLRDGEGTRGIAVQGGP